MMQVQFNRPATLKGVTYGKGLHTVPAPDVENDWFFEALVKDGDAVIMQSPPSDEQDQPETKRARKPKNGPSPIQA